MKHPAPVPPLPPPSPSWAAACLQMRAKEDGRPGGREGAAWCSTVQLQGITAWHWHGTGEDRELQGPLHISVAAILPITVCAGDPASLGSHARDPASLGSHASWHECSPASNSQPSHCLPSKAISSERTTVARGIYHFLGCRIPSVDKVVYANRRQPLSPSYFSLLDLQLIIGYGGDQSPKSPGSALAPHSD